ncbi:MAG: hypothetical protein WAL59_02970 [Roseiarcus sp.]
MTFSWLVLYAVVLAKLEDRLRLPAVRRAIEALTGTLLIGLGVRSPPTSDNRSEDREVRK